MLLPIAYLPSVSWCTAFWNAEKVVLEACEHYQKGSLRNRAYIAGPNGVQLLSIPLLKGKHQQTPVREVRIANHEPWQRQHWRTIKTAYGNAPYFEHYADALQQFYEKEHAFLFEYNLALIRFALVEKLGWKGELELSELFNPLGIHARSFEGNAAGSGPAYPQVFQEKHGFIPNLSVLDLLFCCGKRSVEILERAQ